MVNALQINYLILSVELLEHTSLQQTVFAVNINIRYQSQKFPGDCHVCHYLRLDITLTGTTTDQSVTNTCSPMVFTDSQKQVNHQ